MTTTAWHETYFESQPDIVSEELEIVDFGLVVGCAPWPFPDEFKISYSNVFYQGIFQAIAAAGIPKSSLKFTSPVKALEINRAPGGDQTGWFGISYQEPGKSFGITVDDERFQIRCTRIRLVELVALAGSIFSRISQAWVSDGLASPMLLFDRAHSVDFSFELLLRLGKDKVQQKPVKNYQLLAEALSLHRRPGGAGQLAVADALPTIGAERFVRMDFTQHALKRIDGIDFITGITLQGPLNEANSLLNVGTFLRSTDEFGFDFKKALNWEIAFVSFFRDIVLKRLLANLLCSTHYTNR